MAAPEGVTPIYNNVVISVYGGGGFGIIAATPQTAVGTVYKIGSNVYRINVGQKVGFKTDVFFATNVTSEETFAVVNLDDIVITYEEITPP